MLHRTYHINNEQMVGMHHACPVFEQMNERGSGEVTLWEFREYFDLPDDSSTTRLFRCFDEDRDNRIGFLEFVVALWTYCEENSIHYYIFEILL